MSLNDTKNFNYYSNIEKFYKENSDIFTTLEVKMSDDFKISRHIFKDAIKRTLSEILEGGPKSFLWVKKVSFKYKVFYYSVMLFFLFNAIFGKKIKKLISKKVVFDVWNINGYNYFYKPILGLLKKSNVLLYITDQHNFFKKVNFDTVKINSSKYSYDSHISKNIFKTQFASFGFYSDISKQLNINIIYIVLNIFRTIAMYNTHAKQINCYVLFSAADNYYNSLRYDIYKKNGIQNIALLQNGLRTGKWANDAVDLYTYCDYYFGFGIEQINIQKGMVCANKIPIGSIKLDFMLDRYRNYSKKENFDIVFLASYEEEDTPYVKVKTYEKIIDNLCLFKKNHPNLSVYYSDKKRGNKSIKHNLMMNKMKLSGIICSSSNIGNSYEAILCSEVALFYRTTIGLEALAMNKAVLNLNYDKDMIPISQKDRVLMLTSPSYNDFENRILSLLEVDKNNTGYNSERLTYRYMNNSNYNNLPKNIIDIVFKGCTKDCDSC
jgi:hypothetical protein